MNKFIRFLSIAAAAISVCCERRPLDILATELKIVHNPDYALAFTAPATTPEHYRVNMYDAESGTLVYKDFIPDGGGNVKSLPGEYACFICNYDEGSLILTGESNLSTICLTGAAAGDAADSTFKLCQTKLRSMTKVPTVQKSAEDLPTDGQSVMILDNCFWAGSCPASVPSLAETDTVYTISVNTRSVLRQGHISLENIKGTEHIAVMECFITNLSAGVNPVTMELSETTVTERFVIPCKDGKASGDFLYFGVNGNDEPHILYALITDTAGGLYLYTYDLGPIDEADNLAFKIESGMDVPEPTKQGGGGFKPSVDEWDIEIHDIPLGQ